jgi:uncharacterized protein
VAATVAVNGRSKFSAASPLLYSFSVQWSCPICGKAVDSDATPDFPFCSERCRLLDLGNWASEKYKISQPVIDEPTPDSPAHQRDADEPRN